MYCAYLFFLFCFLFFHFFGPVPPLSGQPTALGHPRWPTPPPGTGSVGWVQTRECFMAIMRATVLPLQSHLGAEGHILTENTSLSRFSAGLHSKNHPVAVGGILVSGGLAAIFAKQESARLRYPTRFAGKSQGYTSVKSGRPTSVHQRGIGLASGSIYPQNMPLIPPLTLSRR